jgi:transcriptional regulator with XRE-family HTH domain
VTTMVVPEMARQFGKRKLAKARKAKGWSEMRLADEIGSSLSSVKNWEAGTNEPSLPLFLRLCDVLGVQERDLIDVVQ